MWIDGNRIFEVDDAPLVEEIIWLSYHHWRKPTKHMEQNMKLLDDPNLLPEEVLQALDAGWEKLKGISGNTGTKNYSLRMTEFRNLNENGMIFVKNPILLIICHPSMNSTRVLTGSNTNLEGLFNKRHIHTQPSRSHPNNATP